MNQDKIDRATRDLTAIAAKVLNALPVTAPWSVGAIIGELKRQGHNIDPRTVAGCLGSLVRDGLAKEPTTGHFVRVQAKPRPEPAAPAFELSPNPPPLPDLLGRNPAATPKPPAALDRLAALAERIRKLIRHPLGAVATEVERIATEAEDIALAAEEERQRHRKELAAFRQFKALIKSADED